jgi:hypothetical protein
VSVALTLLSLLLPARAAASPSARLVYVRNPGTETCPDEAAIRAAVSARLGYDPFFRSAPATMTVELTMVGDTYRARIQLVDEDGTVRGVRDLAQPGPRCEPIIDTVALTMSIAIDPLSLTRAPGPQAPPEAAPTLPVEDVPGATAHVPASPGLGGAPPTSRSSTEFHLDAGLGLGLWVDAAPAPSPSGDLFLRLRAWQHWSLALEARADLPASQTVPTPPTGTVDVQTWIAYGSLVPCFHLRVFSGCVVGDVGAIHATSTAKVPSHSSALDAAVGPRIGAEWALSRVFALWAHLDGLWAFKQQELQISGSTVSTLSAFSLGVTLGGSVRLF